MAYNFREMDERANEIAIEVENAAGAAANVSSQAQCNWNLPSSYFGLNNSTSLKVRIHEAGFILKRAMEMRDPYLICDRRGYLQSFSSCMIGTEMVDWLSALAIDTLHSIRNISLTRFQVVGMWQALLENGVIAHGNTPLFFTPY
ncbi:unnamed protein product [Litomosoides sigmodontis]|uniref:DEP domain-containing protein n=1 Tax=Litomosoides sigmodontis TaxID=42156 RepID=A0A3P7KFW7_LITSI|nr:unnamed protein product [Litomosoides sigmodontis]